MSFLSGLKNILTAPTKLLTKPIQKTIGSSKKLFRGDIRGAGSELNPLSRANRSGALGDLKGLALPWRGGSSPMPGAPQVAPGAQDYMNSFSPEDQGNIKSSFSGSPTGMNDWFKNAQAAGAVPQPAAPPMGAPPMGAAGPGMMSPINMGMKRRPNPEDDYPPY